MNNKVRDDPEFKLSEIEKELEKYEKKRFLVMPVSRIREILGVKERNKKKII